MTPTDNPKEPLLGPNMTKEKSYQTVQPLWEPTVRVPEKGGFENQECEYVDHYEAHEDRDEIIDDEMFDSYVPRKSPSGDPVGD